MLFLTDDGYFACGVTEGFGSAEISFGCRHVWVEGNLPEMTIWILEVPLHDGRPTHRDLAGNADGERLIIFTNDLQLDKRRRTSATG